jgi:threonylcarbamoyladenosine tRNA methylthiotransferase MtaB
MGAEEWGRWPSLPDPRPLSSPLKYAVVTFGCRVNQADSLAIEGELRARGAIDAPPADADLIIVNTCSVTSTADQGARQTIRRIVRDNPGVRVVVTGCYATRRPDEVAGLPNVVRVVRNAEKDDLVGSIAGGVGLTTAERFGDGDDACGAPAAAAPVTLMPGVAGRTAMTLRVQTGCDQRCSYCIIPETRGAGRSRPLADVIRDVQRAVDAGYKEVAITGVHLGSYGRDLGEPRSLTDLVTELAGWPDDVLFRISSLEPMDCTPEIVDLVASSPRLAPHFHLPLQHGSDAMLRAMRRPYTAVQYRGLVERIRERLPHASIGTDVIVGFPGETGGQFEEMAAWLEALPLTHLHVFPYSDRPGTDASRLPDKVDGSAIRARGQRVRSIGAAKAQAFRASQTGSTRRALTVEGGWAAVTDNYLKVRLPREYPRNQWVDAVIDGG